MIRKYLQNVWLNLKRDKLSSFINLIGLATGIATFILIVVYVHNELSYDKFHENYNRICEVNTNGTFNCCAPIAIWLKDKYPEIESIVRMDVDFGGGEAAILKYSEDNQQQSLDVTDIIYAESGFFDMFSFKVLLGDANKALSNPNSIVLTEGIARKLFGDENPIGKNIRFLSKIRDSSHDLTITAVMEDAPVHSSIHYNGIISFATRYAEDPQMDEDWGNWGYPTYIMLNKSTSYTDVESKVNIPWLRFVSEKFNVTIDSETEKEVSLQFVPIQDVQFYKNNKRQFIYLILVIGVIVILIAIVNFINLSIAKSSLRAKEIGVKKAFGSGRMRIICQFLLESITLSFLATFLAILIVETMNPVFEKITGWNILPETGNRFYIILILVAGTVIIGIIAGLYPALYLSSFKPEKIFKNEISKGNKGRNFKKLLIVLQFVISLSLIICTIIITKQVRYLKTKDIGFDKENLIYFSARANIWEKYDTFKQRLLQNPNIHKIAASNTPLAQEFPMTNSAVINDKERSFYTLTVDQDFVQTMGLKIIEGRDFSWDINSDKYGTMIINETAVEEFELTQPIGTELKMFNHKITIIGVMKDFHAGSFHQEIPPSALWIAPWNGTINIRIDGKNMDQSIAYIRKVWDEFSPDIPFEYHFLDEKYDSLYKSEERFNLLIAYFSILAIFISCLGLFGLVSFSIVQRFKEIGIRKVNGAKSFEIITLLNKSFIIWVIVAFIIACPIALYAMKRWLQNFAYKTEISCWIFILAGAIALIIVLLTVSWQSWRAATKNPVDALRYE